MAKRKGDTKKDTVGSKKVPTRPIEMTLDAHHVTVYANSAQVVVSPWDFRFGLGQVAEATEERIRINQLATVYMSPQHVKAFIDLASKKLTEYEAEHGPVTTKTSD